MLKGPTCSKLNGEGWSPGYRFCINIRQRDYSLGLIRTNYEKQQSFVQVETQGPVLRGTYGEIVGP